MRGVVQETNFPSQQDENDWKRWLADCIAYGGETGADPRQTAEVMWNVLSRRRRPAATAAESTGRVPQVTVRAGRQYETDSIQPVSIHVNGCLVGSALLRQEIAAVLKRYQMRNNGGII